MTGSLLIIGGLMAGTVYLVVSAYRLGHSAGELRGQLTALRILEAIEQRCPAHDGPIWFGVDLAASQPERPHDAASS